MPASVKKRVISSSNWCNESKSEDNVFLSEKSSISDKIVPKSPATR